MKHSFLTFGRNAATAALLTVLVASTAHGRLIFTTDEDGVPVDSWTLNIDDVATPQIDLNFGVSTGATIGFDTVTSQFEINQDVNFLGNQAVDLRIENAAGVPVACTPADAGRLYFDTLTAEMYFCDGTTWIGMGEIPGGSITTVEIADGTITNADLAVSSVSTTNIIDGTITNADLGADSVTTANILDNTVTTADIADGTITNVDLAADSVTTTNIVDGTIVNADLADDSVTIANIDAGGAASSVLTTDGSGNPQWESRLNFVSSALPAGNIYVGNAAGTAQSVPLSGDVSLTSTGAVTINASAVTTTEIADGTIINADLAGNSVNTTNIVDSTIVNADLAADSVTTANIVDGTIINADLATDSVDTTNIVDGTIVQADRAIVEKQKVISPEYPNFTLQADGTDNRGTMESDYDNGTLHNYYKWSTRRTTVQDYDIVTQLTLPDDFVAWSTTTAPITVDYKTDSAAAADNQVTITLQDSAGVALPLTGGTALTSGAGVWVDDQPLTFAGGTFLPGDVVTLRMKLSSKATGGVPSPAYVGQITLNYQAQ